MQLNKFTPEEIKTIHHTFLKDKDGDLCDVPFRDQFIQTCERTGLSPYSRQIMASPRNSKQRDGSYKKVWNTVVTIDGLRAVAAATGEYEGQGGPWWCGQDGIWTDIWTKNEPPFAAKVEVYRHGFRQAMVATARFKAYAQTFKDGRLNEIWEKFGDHMNAKVAEALALRKAFPQLGGLYTTDEMAQAGITSPDIEAETNRELQRAGLITNTTPEPAQPVAQPAATPAPVPAAAAVQPPTAEPEKSAGSRKRGGKGSSEEAQPEAAPEQPKAPTHLVERFNAYLARIVAIDSQKTFAGDEAEVAKLEPALTTGWELLDHVLREVKGMSTGIATTTWQALKAEAVAEIRANAKLPGKGAKMNELLNRQQKMIALQLGV